MILIAQYTAKKLNTILPKLWGNGKTRNSCGFSHLLVTSVQDEQTVLGHQLRPVQGSTHWTASKELKNVLLCNILDLVTHHTIGRLYTWSEIQAALIPSKLSITLMYTLHSKSSVLVIVHVCSDVTTTTICLEKGYANAYTIPM